jgi:hypothetical protein
MTRRASIGIQLEGHGGAYSLGLPRRDPNPISLVNRLLRFSISAMILEPVLPVTPITATVMIYFDDYKNCLDNRKQVKPLG